MLGLIQADIHQKDFLFHDRDVRPTDFGGRGRGYCPYDFVVTVSELAGFPRYTALRTALVVGHLRTRALSCAHEGQNQLSYSCPEPLLR